MWPGVAGRQLTFFASPKKVSKERRPQNRRPFGRKPLHRLPSFGRCEACFAKPLPHPSRQSDDRPLRKTRTRTLATKRFGLCSSSNIRSGLPRSSLHRSASHMGNSKTGSRAKANSKANQIQWLIQIQRLTHFEFTKLSCKKKAHRWVRRMTHS